jgi:Cadherin domain
LTAHDNDAEPFNRFRFRLTAAAKGHSGAARLFEIDSSSGLIKTLATLDREERESHQLVGIVDQVDHRGRDAVNILPGMSTNVSIIVQVSSTGDNDKILMKLSIHRCDFGATYHIPGITNKFHCTGK